MNLNEAIQRTFSRELPNVIVEVSEINKFLKVDVECPSKKSVNKYSHEAFDLLVELTGARPDCTINDNACTFTVQPVFFDEV